MNTSKTANPKLNHDSKLEASLAEIRKLLSNLGGEVAGLEASYTKVLSVLERFEGAADFDDLTGLMRRRAFFRKWQALLDECEKVNQATGVLMIDIDHFKRINDTHGHATGDQVIAKVAELLKQYESPTCFVSRLGGEEFAIATRATDVELLGMAELIRRGAERMHGQVSENVEWKCTVSVGMASSKTQGTDATKLLKAADEALYVAKQKGRNQVRSAA